MNQQLTTVESIIHHMQSGIARVRVHSMVSNNAYTYEIKENATGKKFFINFIAVSGEPAFLGLIDNGQFVRTERSRLHVQAPAYVAFAWLWETLCANKLPESVKVYAV